MAEISGQGIPTTQTAAAVGDIYTDTDTGQKYKCGLAYASKDEKGNDFTYYLWTKLKNESSGSGGTIDQYIDNIKKNTEYIGNLKEDLSNKITKFYASNQGETHITDSDNGKIEDTVLYGKSKQKQYKGINLFPPDTKPKEYVEVSIPKDSFVFWATDGTPANGGNFRFFNEDKTEYMWLGIDSGTTSTRTTLTIDAKYVQNLINEDFDLSKICLGIGSEPIYEPYTGGIPSPSLDYPQEIKSVVNPTVKVCGSNIYDYKNANKTNTVLNVNGTETVAAGYITSDYIPVLDGIYIKGNNKSSDPLRIGLYTEKNEWKIRKDINNSMLYVSSSDAKFIRLSYSMNKTDIVEVYASYANIFEPYTEQTVTLPYTLNAIPVASGGNVTIDGQQLVCDEVDLERGVKMQRVKVRELSPDDEWAYQKLASGNNNFQVRILNADVAIDGKPCFCNILPFKNVIWDDSIQNLPKIYANKQEITVSFPPSSEYSSLEAFKHMLTDVKSVIYYILATPIETPLTQEEASAFKQLMTYYPVTNISVTSDQLDGYTVFNYPISMANGWNYVKQQLNDNRDYIYDTDLQAAEAYVNSEYAVALTELEV